MSPSYRHVLSTICVVSLQMTSLATEAPLIVAHRGLLRHAPENTLANFRACLELRLGFELDVQRTKDGHLVCIHDDTVNRTTNGKGKVVEMTLSQIRKLDAGSWFDSKFADEKVPTIAEVFELVAQYRHHDILIAVDLKSANVEKDVVQLAMKHRVLDRLLFIGRTISEPKVRERLKATSKHAQTAAVANNADEFPAALKENPDWVYVRYLPTKAQVEAVHRVKKRVFIAGSKVSGNLPKNWQHVTDVGVDGVLTDYPLNLRLSLKKKRR